MGQVNVRVQLVNAAKFIATFAILSVITVAMAPVSSYAEEGDPVPPTVVIPVACSVAPPEVFVSGIQFAPTTPTNFQGLQWNWTFSPPETAEAGTPFAFDNYKYAIYNGSTFQSEGTLATNVTTLDYSAPTDGTYSLYLWTVEGAGEPSYCSVAAIPLDFHPPVITSNGYTLDTITGTATPILSTEETGLSYSWAVNGVDSGVEISDSAALNPNFTFLLDDTYIFTLTATDSFGNSTIVPLTINYLAPFVLPPTGPAIIPEEIVPDPVQTFVLLEDTAPVASSTPVPAIDGKLPPAVDASIYSSTAQARDDSSASEKGVAGGVAASRDGWKVLGVVWYWWILIVAVVVTVRFWLMRTYQTPFLADDI